jgi:hypothetical protein
MKCDIYFVTISPDVNTIPLLILQPSINKVLKKIASPVWVTQAKNSNFAVCLYVRKRTGQEALALL